MWALASLAAWKHSLLRLSAAGEKKVWQKWQKCDWWFCSLLRPSWAIHNCSYLPSIDAAPPLASFLFSRTVRRGCVNVYHVACVVQLFWKMTARQKREAKKRRSRLSQLLITVSSKLRATVLSSRYLVVAWKKEIGCLGSRLKTQCAAHHFTFYKDRWSCLEPLV